MAYFFFVHLFFGAEERIMSNLSRFVLIIWFLVVLILTQSYTASLTSMLTVLQLQPTVTDVNVLIRNNERIGYKNGSFVYEFLRKMRIDDSKLVPFNYIEQMVELLMKGSENGGIAAAFQEIPYLELFLSKYCSKYTVAGPTYRADGFGFVWFHFPAHNLSTSRHYAEMLALIICFGLFYLFSGVSYRFSSGS